MNLFQFSRVKTRFAVWFLIVALVPLLTVSTIVYFQRSQEIKRQQFEKLIAIRDLKVDRLNAWLDEREGGVRTIAGNLEIRSLAPVLNRDGDVLQPDLQQLSDNAHDLLTSYLMNYHAFSEIVIVHPETGRVRLATDVNANGRIEAQNLAFTEPLRSQELYIQDMYYSNLHKKPEMTYSIPIFGIADAHAIIGILIARIDLERTIYALLLNRTGMGQTGETLIVNKQGFALNELRWHEHAPLQLHILAQPAVNASQGNTGIIEADDYRPEPVLAAYTYIPRMQWGLVAKQDLAESYQPIAAMLRQIISLVSVSIVVVFALAVVVANSISRPITQMRETSKHIADGNMAMRYTLAGRDEFSDLAQSLNSMTSALAARITIQNAGALLADILVQVDSMAEFQQVLPRHLLHVSESQVAVLYTLDSSGERFQPTFSIGADSAALRHCSATSYEGEIGHALQQNAIVYIADIPDDTVLSFPTISGNMRPKAIVSIPVLVSERIEAVISLSSVRNYTPEQREILQQSWVGINTKYANLQAADTVKLLAQELNTKNQELRVQAEELKVQSAELQQQNGELERRSRQIAEANRLKSEFLSNMSHELRTPLNSVIALSRVLMLQSKQALSEEEFSYLEIIARNGKHLLELINNILDISKIEAGKVEVASNTFAVQEVVHSVVESLEPLAADKGFHLHVALPDNLPLLFSDNGKVRQILQNLVGNAVKFTKQGFVKIRGRVAANHLLIIVQDSGIGIPDEALSQIFEEFRQVDGSTSRHYEGTGLGLSIALRHARLLGGDIQVESVLGQGSVFTLTLPLTPGVAALPEIAVVPGLEPDLPADASALPLVLVVDDSPRMVEMLSEYLREDGYHVIGANSGKEALDLARRHHPLAITLDIVMPDMDGWETLQHLKEDAETADIPVIVVSITDDRDTAYALGAVGYVSKPVLHDDLVREIYRFVGHAVSSVLIVDDNPIDRVQVERMLAEEGFQTFTAESGPHCLDFLQNHRPDAIILDLMMPGMDGFTVLDTLRRNASTRDLPVIIVTAKDLTSEERRMLQSAAAAIIGKHGMTPYKLTSKITETLNAVAHRQSARRNADSAADKRRLLVVEDSEPAIIQIRHILERQGYVVDVARHGQQAIDALPGNIPDGVILDLMMPGMDGFEVLNHIRSNPTTAMLPVLVLTAKDLTSADLQRLSSDNVQQLVRKGDVDQEELLFKIRLMLGSVPKADLTPQPKSSGERNSPKAKPLNSPPGRGNGWVAESDSMSMSETQPNPSLKGNSSSRSGSDNKKSTPEKASGPGDEVDPERATILVVEDYADNMLTLRAILQHQYRLVEAVDGEDGLQQAFKTLPTVILLDLSLPKMDGFEVVARLKDHAATRSIPVIALTAHAMTGDREKAMNAGCDDYLSKPIEPETLLACLEKWLTM